MLQLLLAVLAITLISVSGWGLVEQVHLQQVVTDQRETARRLDVAAEAIQGKLTAMPGRDGLFAPAPNNPIGGWSQIPNGIGGVNTNATGVPFLYCPVVVAPNGVHNQVGDDNSQVNMPAGVAHYGIQVQNGLVIGSDADIPNGSNGSPNLAAFNPVAFLVAAKPGSDSPPRCDAIDLVAGKPHVEGGIVRIVSRPGGALSQNTASKEVSNLYVLAGATGTGRYPNDPAGIDDAMEQYAKYRPSTMTLHIDGSNGIVTPSGNSWNDFAAALSENGSSLTIVGDTFDGNGVPNAVIGGSPSGGTLPAAGKMVLANVAMPAVNVVVGPQSTLNVVGRVTLANGGVVAAGAQSVSSPSGAVVATGNGVCFTSGPQDATFAYSVNGYSGVPANEAAPAKPVRTDFAADDDAGYQTAMEAYDRAYDGWRDQVTAYQTARLSNHSAFSCGTAS